MTPHGAAPALVLDTNVVLDWLVFADAPAVQIGQLIADGTLRWIVTAAMQDELQRVLGYPALQQRDVDASAVWTRATQAWQVVPTPPPMPAHWRLTSRDPDDQKFIDLAVSQRACGLLSRDKALLRLAGPAQQHGVEVATPQAWQRLPCMQAGASVGAWPN
ncbi:MAG: putative toxin-antitoxin system toxin component, PIN family [Burkholderiales bacterium]